MLSQNLVQHGNAAELHLPSSRLMVDAACLAAWQRSEWIHLLAVLWRFLHARPSTRPSETDIYPAA